MKFEQNSIQHAVEAFDNDALTIHPDSNIYGLLDALTEVDDVHVSDLEDVFQAIHLDTATGKHLDEIAKGAQIRRKSGESDDKFRQRIRTQFRASTTGATFDDTVRFVSVMLDTNVTNVELGRHDSKPQTIIVNPYVDDVNDSVLTDSEIIEFTKKVLSTQGDVEMDAAGDFYLTDDAEGNVDGDQYGLTADGQDVGGTLTRDLT